LDLGCDNDMVAHAEVLVSQDFCLQGNGLQRIGMIGNAS
jgi:hypothetical protein